MRGLLLTLLLLSPTVARAESDADLEAARKLFERGRALFLDGNYTGAAREFEGARRLKAVPDFDFNIGLCYENLERPREALEAFERYINATVDPKSLADAREHANEMKRRLAARSGSVAPPENPVGSSGPSLAPPLLVAVLAIGLAAAGTGLLLSVGAEYDKLYISWLAGPRTPDLQARARDLELRDTVGYVLIAAAAAAAIADAILFGVTLHRRADRPTAWIAPSPSGLAAGARF